MTAKTLQQIKEVKAKTTPIFERYGVEKAGVFGSFARGKAKGKSDIDFYIIYGPRTTLFDVGGLNYDLEQLLGRNIDLADGRMLKRELKPSILKDLTMLYEKGK